jgi:hypothetical protein
MSNAGGILPRTTRTSRTNHTNREQTPSNRITTKAKKAHKGKIKIPQAIILPSFALFAFAVNLPSPAYRNFVVIFSSLSAKQTALRTDNKLI